MKGEFTNDWFESHARAAWEVCLPNIEPARVLEIGSFEGKVACYLLQRAKAPLEVHCIDTWTGSPEFAGVDMLAVEERFKRNVASCKGQHKVIVHKGESSFVLPTMQQFYRCFFDLVYVDGSHLAADVLADAVMSYPLLRSRGILVFDDYLWHQKRTLTATPKIAIDSFLNCYRDQLHVAFLSNNQVWVQRV